MHRVIRPAGLALLFALPLGAQQTITWSDALDRARQSAPAIVAARMRIEEARGRTRTASLPVASNPTLAVEAGRRNGDATSTDFGIEVAQSIDFPQRRRARIDAVNAIVRQEEQRAAEVERETLRDVASSFLRALETRERAESLASAKQLAEEALRIAERRYAAGDVAQLDVNLARTAVARAEAEVRTANAELVASATRLQVLLGVSEPLAIAGSLREVASIDVTSANDRADVRLLDAEIAEAEAEQRNARMLRWPDFDLRAAYRNEERDRILLGGIGLSLPIFHRGQDAIAITYARIARLRMEREALTRAIDADVRGARASYDALRTAASAYERTVLPLIDENERLALESYDVGQIGLADLLVVRRDALDARRAFLELLIETRLAEVELRAKAGVWK